MKNNTSPTKDYLNKALETLPADNALQEIRTYIRTAIHKLEHVENKRAKREQQPQTQHATWYEMISGSVENPYTSKRTMDIINRMIDEEKKKLEEIQTNKTKSKKIESEETLLD